MRMMIALLVLLLAGVEADAAPESHGCPTDGMVPYVSPIGLGRLTLKAIYCLPLPEAGVPRSGPALSPDGGAYFAVDSVNGLWLGSLAANSPAYQFEGRLAGWMPYHQTPFAWSANSRSVIGFRQDSVYPSGWPLGPLRPTLFFPDGSEQPLPQLSHPNGPLDEIYWVGTSGKAVAAFGTRGAYYRPEHDDLHPTIALVDVLSGTVLQSVDIADIPGAPLEPNIAFVSSRLNAAGGVEALMVLSGVWLHWVQGEEPQRVQITPLRKAKGFFTLTPDGGSVLIAKGLSATGMICEFSNTCPPPIPVSGTVAELRDITTGHLIWSITGTARKFAPHRIPAVSPDGKYGLISMPHRGTTPSIGLISMESGAILAELPECYWASNCQMSFSSDSRTVWLSGRYYMMSYAISD